MRRFWVQMEVEVMVSQALLDSVLTEEWRSVMYPTVNTPALVAEHLAFNLVQGRGLTNLDGFADQKEDAATCTDPEVVDSHELEPFKRGGRTRIKKATKSARRRPVAHTR
jgi:hypothetical protein